MGPDSSGPETILFLDSSHALVLLFKITELDLSVLCSWNILAEPSVDNFLQCTFSVVIRILTQVLTSHLFDKMREGLEEGGEERDIKWLHGSASSADMHLGLEGR